MIYSASDLTKKSAAQILYENIHGKRRPTQGAIDGNAYAETVQTSEYVEMRGAYNAFDDIDIYFSIDEFFLGGASMVLHEIKMVRDMSSYEDWYFNSSILQTAFYLSLSRSVEHYQRATFALKQYGNLEIDIPLDVKREVVLLFGEDKYSVDVTNDNAVLNYFKRKIRAIEERSFDVCRDYDKVHKFRHFQDLHEVITFKKIV